MRLKHYRVRWEDWTHRHTISTVVPARTARGAVARWRRSAPHGELVSIMRLGQ